MPDGMQPGRTSETPSFRSRHGRILVFIVMYESVRQVRSLLERIPRQLVDDPDVDFLCIDDASSDATCDIAADWASRQPAGRVTVLRNPVNQGYGGNQKLGYRLALDRGYDFVILLHGDGQYAPELLPKFIETWRETGADVVLGSRMDDLRSARRGGMPLYKMAGNRVLTWLQNRLTGLGLSEYHTGYRGYATAFLRRVPFEIATNDFHFDTEILLQARHVGAGIEEFSIPTHYGDEVCHVPGLRYAANVVLSTLQYKMHRLGMLCSLKYPDLDPGRYDDKADVLDSSRAMALRAVERAGERTALDVGCGPGHVARRPESAGLEGTDIDTAETFAETMSEFHQADLERERPVREAGERAWSRER